MDRLMPSFKLTHQGQSYKVTAPDEATALETFYEQMSGAPQVQEMPRKTGTGAALARGVADTLTFGLSDEIGAGLSAATGVHGTFGDYEGNLARARAAHAYDEQHNPTARLIGQVGGGVGSGVGLARAGLLATPKLAPTATRLTRYGTAAGEGAALAAGYGLGSGEGAEGRLEEAAKAVGPGAVFGALGEAAAPALSRVVGAGVNLARRVFDDADPAAAIAQAKTTMADVLGINAADIPDSIASQFAQQAARAADPAAAARSAAGGEFGIPLTRGQATGNMADLAFEEAARNEARGAIAGNTVRKIDTARNEAIDRAKMTLAEEMNQGRPVTTTSQTELSQEVLEAARGAAQREMGEVDAAYEAARNAGLQVRAGSVLDARAKVREGLEDFVINPTSTPYATRALQEIDEMANMRGALADRVTGTVPDDETITGVSVAGIEKVRSKLLRYAENATPEDARAVRAVRRSFDAWLDEVGDDQLMAGTKEGLGLWKAARKARREYGQKFEANPRQSDDDAGRLMERMLEKDVTETEVANALMGSAKAGERGVSTRLAARLKNILGQDSPEFGSVKQAVWFRLVNGEKGEASKLGPQAISQRILAFTTGKAEPFAKVLYTPAELAKMRRFAVAVGQTVTPPGATNPSKSGYEMARAAADAAKSVATMFGTAVGGPGMGIAARVGTGLFTEARNIGQSRRASRPIVRRRYEAGPRAGTAGAAAGYTASGEDPTAGVPLIFNLNR